MSKKINPPEDTLRKIREFSSNLINIINAREDKKATKRNKFKKTHALSTIDMNIALMLRLRGNFIPYAINKTKRKRELQHLLTINPNAEIIFMHKPEYAIPLSKKTFSFSEPQDFVKLIRAWKEGILISVKYTGEWKKKRGT